MIKLQQLFLVVFLFIANTVYSNNNNLKSEKVDYYRNYINKYKFTNIDSAFYYAEKGIEYFQNSNDKIGESYIKLAKAEIYEERAEFNEARVLALNSLDIFYELNFTIGVAEAYHILGILEARQSNYTQAASYFLRSIYLCEKLKNISGQISNSISYAMLNAKLGDFKKAEFYLNKALKLNGNTKGGAYVNINNNFGNIYGMQGRPAEALKYIKLALSVPDSPHFFASKLSLLTNAGNANTELKNFKEAEKYYDEGLMLSRKYGLKEQEARLIFNKAIMYEDTDPNQCIMHLEQALTIAKSINEKQLCTEILIGLCQIKKRKGDFEGALLSFEEYQLYKDSIINFDVKKDIELLQSKYELEKTESSLKDLELKNQKNRIQLQIGILIATALIVIAFLLFYYLKKTNKLNKKLEASVLVRNKLLSIIAHDLKTPISNINTLMLEIKNNSLTKLEQTMLMETLHQHTIITEETLENLLKWGQAQLKGVEVNTSTFNIKDNIAKVVGLLTLQAISKDIIINNNVTNDYKVNFDKDHFDFIIRNVLSNALKFSKNNSSITINTLESNSEFFQIQIIDQGIGIDSNKLKDIFNTSSAGYGTNNERGIGLGLGLIKEYMNANQGKIVVESEIGKGTIVNLYIKKYTK